MRLEHLKLRNFRCFQELSLEFDPELNWIVGQNASGKTSLLEALFFLGHGRSFRSARPDRLVRSGSAGFEIVARLAAERGQQVLGMGRTAGVTEARFAGEPLKSMAQAAKILPVVVLDSEMSNLISGGPSERRRWLDWGVFHVEHSFLPTWREYQQVVRQRNEALKTAASERMLQPWTQAVARTGTRLTDLRRGYFDALQPLIAEYAAIALPGVPVSADFRQGWAEDDALLESLEKHLPRDRETGTTRSGPHRADVQFRVEGFPADERLSRGQQKSLAGALWLAQVQAFVRNTTDRPLLLVDDLAAELDAEHLERFLALLNRQDAQRVLTAIGDAEVARTGLSGGRVFHVEQAL